MSGSFNVGGIPSLFKKITFEGSTGTGRINLPDAGTTAADGIQFGTGTANLYRSNGIRTDGYFTMGDAFYMAGGSLVFSKLGGTLKLNDNLSWTGLIFKGLYTIEGTSLTGSSATSALSITQTWNTTGSPTLIFANVLHSASGASSLLMDLQYASVSKFLVTKAGDLSCAGATFGYLTLTNGASFAFGTRSVIASTANNNVRFTNYAGTDFGLLQFGGTTSSFPSLKRSTTNLQVRLADDSAFSFIEDLYRRAGSGSPEGVVTAPIGAYYSRTDGGAGTSLYVKESGTGNTGWIAK